MNFTRLAFAALLLAPATAAQTTHDVTTNGFDFVPIKVTIQMGDTVRWTMAGPFHTVTDEPTLGPPLFDTGTIPTGAVFEFTYDEAAISQSARPNGTYDYICVTHLFANMVGTVQVEDIPLAVDKVIMSAGAGGTQTWTLNAGAANAGMFYLLLGSVSGTSPGIPVDGHVLPLNLDAYTLFTLANANGVAHINTFGVLDGNGKASANLTVPPGVSGLVGKNFNHAYAVIDALGSGQVTFTSNSAPIFFGN